MNELVKDHVRDYCCNPRKVRMSNKKTSILRSDDLRPRMYVAILHTRGQAYAHLKGVPLRVLSVDRPFMLALIVSPITDMQIIDLRYVLLKKCSRQYADKFFETVKREQSHNDNLSGPFMIPMPPHPNSEGSSK